MLVSPDGYTIEEESNKNRLVIHMPSTLETVQSTTDTINDRRSSLSDEDLFVILQIVRYMYKK